MNIEDETITPVITGSTTREIHNGWGGKKPLPVADFPGGRQIVLVPSKRLLKSLLKGKSVLSLVIMDDGSLSMTGQPFEISKIN